MLTCKFNNDSHKFHHSFYPISASGHRLTRNVEKVPSAHTEMSITEHRDYLNSTATYSYNRQDLKKIKGSLKTHFFLATHQLLLCENKSNKAKERQKKNLISQNLTAFLCSLFYYSVLVCVWSHGTNHIHNCFTFNTVTNGQYYKTCKWSTATKRSFQLSSAPWHPHKVCVKLKIICQGTTAYKENWKKLWGKRIKRKNTKTDSNLEKHRQLVKWKNRDPMTSMPTKLLPSQYSERT